MSGIFVIDEDLCQGHGRCYTLAPECFTPDEMGRGQVTSAALPPDPERIVRACPEGAIAISNRDEEASS